MKRLLYIINPKSGTGRKHNIEALINKYSQKSIPTIIFTEYAGHAYEIAKNERDNYDGVIAVGGDGSVNEVSAGLINSNTAFGVIPCGSGNGFSNNLKIPLKKKRAIEVIDRFKIKAVDAVKINDKYFVNMAGIGYDALIAHKFAQYHKRGLLSYVKLILREYKNYKRVRYDLTLDDFENKEFTSFLLTIANGKQWGNNAYIAPGAELDDGLLNITILERLPLIAAASLAIRLFIRKIENSKHIHTFSSSKVVIRKPGEIIAHIDGEPLVFRDKIEIVVLEKALNVIVR